MNYIDIEKEKVFRDRTDIDEFDVNNPDKLDAIMLKRISSTDIVKFENARDNILKCFNNAYYIAILILNDGHAELNFNFYLETAGKVIPLIDRYGYINYQYYYYESMTMAMVFNYVLACDIESNSNVVNNPTLKVIFDHYKEKIYRDSSSHDAYQLFFDNIMHPDDIKTGMVDKELFFPKLPLEDTPSEVVIKQQKARIKELEEEIEFLKADIPSVEVKFKGQRAYIARLILEKLVKTIRNSDKKQMSIIMKAISGAEVKSCQNVFSTPPQMDNIKDKEKINEAFKKLNIDIII